MPVRSSTAIWEGNLKNGRGRMKLGSGAFEGGYSFASRFEQGAGTNPEELIAAAHAGCFSMALSMILETKGYIAERITTEARVHIDKMGSGFKITTVELVTEAKVPGIDEKVLRDAAEEAKKGCPVSMALSGGVDIRLMKVGLARPMAA